MMNRLAALFDRQPRTAEGWLVRMGRPRVGARTQQAFLDWLEEDAGNLRRYESAKADMAAVATLRGVLEGELARVRRERKADGSRRWVMAGGLVAAGVAAVVVFSSGVLVPVQTQMFEGEAGRITDVVLADGSRVTLDAGAAVEVALADDFRRVRLVRGAAFFDVAHDQGRPFQVAVADRRVIVTGTRFEAALDHERAEVSLLEGRVSVGFRDVGARRALAEATRLEPGQRLSFTSGRKDERLERLDVERATAWRNRKLVFRDAPLSEVISAASRYADGTLIVADERLDRVRVTAVLPLEGRGDLVERMDNLLPISVERLPDGGARIHAD